MATIIEIVDESSNQVIILEWDDLDNLPDFEHGYPASTRTRKMTAAEGAMDFLTELRRLNEHHATKSY